MGGTVSGRLVVLLMTPLLTSSFSAEAFGNYGTFISISNILTVLFTGRFEISLYGLDQSKINNRLNFIINLIIRILGLTTIIGLFLILLFPIRWWYILLPVSAAIAASHESLRILNVKHSNYQFLGLNELFRLSFISVIPLILRPLSGVSLILGDILGKFLSLFTLVSIFQNSELKVSRIGIKDLYRLVMMYMIDIRTIASAKVLNSINFEAPVLLMTLFFEAYEVGIFFIGRRLVASAISVVTISLSDIYNSRASALRLKSIVQLDRFFIKFSLLLTLVSVCFVFVLISIGEYVIDFFVKQNSIEVWRLVFVSIPFFVGQIIVAPISNHFNITGCFKLTQSWELIRFGLNIFVLLIGLLFHPGLIMFIFIYSMVNFVSYLCFFILFGINNRRRSVDSNF